MRMLLFTFILIFLYCGNDNRKDLNAIGKESTRLDSIQIVGKSQEKDHLITFLSGKTLDVRTNFYTDSIIDSILIEKEIFKAVYKHCGKGILNLNLFSILKRKNNLEYKHLKEITTAHAISINEQNYYFNGKNNAASIPNKGTLVLLKSTIYSLFSKGNHVCNILVLDTIHQIRKAQPPSE